MRGIEDFFCYGFGRLIRQTIVVFHLLAPLYSPSKSDSLCLLYIVLCCHVSYTSKWSPSLMSVPPFSSFQPYYTNRASLPPNSGPRGVPQSSGPRSVTPTHVYQASPGSQMMMIPGQQLPFPSSPQGPAYFIPGQVRHTQIYLQT